MSRETVIQRALRELAGLGDSAEEVKSRAWQRKQDDPIAAANAVIETEKRFALDTLRHFSGVDFGNDVDQWWAWFRKNMPDKLDELPEELRRSPKRPLR